MISIYIYTQPVEQKCTYWKLVSMRRVAASTDVNLFKCLEYCTHKYIVIVRPFVVDCSVNNLHTLLSNLVKVFAGCPVGPIVRPIRCTARFSTMQLFSNFAWGNECRLLFVWSIWCGSMVPAKILPDDSHASWDRCVDRKISTDVCYMCSMPLGHSVQSLCTESIGMCNLSSKRQWNARWHFSATEKHVRLIPLNEVLDYTISVVLIAMCWKIIKMDE